MTGQAYISGNTINQVFISDATTNALTNLDPLGNTTSIGYGINDSGQVTGETSINRSPLHAFISDSTTQALTDLGTLGGAISVGYGINNSGQVTGQAYISGNTTAHAFIGNATNGLTDLGTLGGTYSGGQDINNSGQITGFSQTSGGARHAFISDSTTQALTDLGTLGGSESWGWGINDSGQVTGWSNTITGSPGGAFLWENGVMYDVNNLIDAADPLRGTVTLNAAFDINSFGDIVATGVDANRVGHSYLLTAQRTSSNSVPEPAPLTLLGFGLLGLGLMRKRRG